MKDSRQSRLLSPELFKNLTGQAGSARVELLSNNLFRKDNIADVQSRRDLL
jgi:hypothetical protein